MKIDLTSIIKNNGGTIKISVKENFDDFRKDIGTVTFTSPVEFNGSVTNFNGMLILKGTAKVDYKSVCDRCGEKIEKSLAVNIEEDIVEHSKAEDIENNPDDDRFTFTGNMLDLDKILADCLLTSLPMSHICRDDCYGLCPICGKRMNSDSCSCGENDPVDPRFDVLKRFFD
ncbi:MAG: DUF177 domain-containing protein [Clostridiaceae bacterium]|nr:DUF177 domain-containing protein [Clostridiaceae bacterium]